jgi:predicted N-formylglutamate amidohydrolase
MITSARKDSDAAVEVLNPNGAGPAVLLCEHASAHIPAVYRGLGLSRAVWDSHAVWDPGALSVSRHLSAMLDAPLIAGGVSRLVFDCNRPPEAPSAIPERSELIEVPGNQNLSDAERAHRTETVYRPFCAAVSAVLEARKAREQATALVTIHSFAPVYFGKPRSVEIGILHDSDSRLADAMLAQAGGPGSRWIERNRPYGPGDGVTHSLKIHGIANGLQNVMIEVRSDLLTTADERAGTARELTTLLTPALRAVGLAKTGELLHA